MKRGYSWVLLLGISGWAPGALAQDFGTAGQFVLGAERITGIAYDRVKTTTESTTGGTSVKDESTVSSTDVSLLGSGGSFYNSGIALPSSTPRLAFDAFVAPGFSIGGSFIYLRHSGKLEDKIETGATNSSTDRDTPTVNTFLLSPRVGYAAQLSPEFVLWPRAGITYSHYGITSKTQSTNGTSTQESSASLTDVSLEIMAVILAAPHFFVMAGPFMEIPLGGGSSTKTNGETSNIKPDLSYFSVGLSAGLGGYF